jgi:parallel beta-helix repeat protein
VRLVLGRIDVVRASGGSGDGFMRLLRRFSGRFVPAALVMLAAGSVEGQTVIHVDDDARPGGDGASWATAYDSLSNALRVAQAGDQIWVAAGRYVGNFTLALGVGLYGGFAGTESELGQRDWVANPTILDGDYDGSVVTAPAGATATTRIDGFVITNGSGTSRSVNPYEYDALYGGGVFVADASPTIANNTIRGNRVSGWSRYDGGGGLYVSASSARIVGNTIVGNRSDDYGGGLYVVDSLALVASNTVIDNNAAGYGGAMHLVRSSAKIERNHVSGNSADYHGGGLYVDSSSPMIQNNDISSNKADLFGGGFYLDSSSPVIANNTITANGAREGGGLYLKSSSPKIVNNTITANGAPSGGGLCLTFSSPTVTNTIVAFNSSGIYQADGSPALRFNCVYGNSAYDYAGLTDPAGTEGNISADPLLAGAPYGNVHIQPGSPCVDAGTNTSASGDFDMDDEARIRPPGGTVDIGADESDGTVWEEGPYTVVRVRPAGDDANDGSSWGESKRTVQAGIDAASALGGEVWVQAGVYEERITLHTYAYVYGGFSGTESVREERDWNVHVTTLDGQERGSVVTGFYGHRVSAIDGFTIRNGGPSPGDGVYLSFCSPTVANNRIKFNNRGLYLGYCSPIIMNNGIIGNNGSGIYLERSFSTIVNNSIRGNGSGIYTDSSHPTLVNNTVTGNGIGIRLEFSSATISNTIVAFNASGIEQAGEGPGTPTLRHNCVYGNRRHDFSGMTDPTGSDGNMSVDPVFGDSRYGNVHIQADSPCVDAGNNADVSGDRDLDGEPRVQPAGGAVDIGADESDGTLWAEGPYTLVRVSPVGEDANDGSSWALAKRTVQAGIDAASELGGEVWVQAGTYEEQITLHPYVYLYGGFSGDETVRDARDWAVHVTTLDGHRDGTVVTARGGYAISAIDGFNIINTKGRRGGGLIVSSCSPLIANNTITGHRDGGLYLTSCYSMIMNNTIAGNRTSHYIGAGLHLESSSPTIVNNTIQGNSAGGRGGGIYLRLASPLILGNVITGNSADEYGGGLCLRESSPTIVSNAITGNGAWQGGGGLYLWRSAPTIANNTIAANDAGRFGGGVYLLASSPTIANTIVAFNSSGVYRNPWYDELPTLRYNCVYGNREYDYSGLSDLTGTDGNISEDPLLADLRYGNVHIQPGSPCVDVGNNADALTESDIDGTSRIQPKDRTVDIGADESDGTFWTAGPYATVRVNLAGDNANDGSSWALAKRTIQAGIDAASALGGEVWVEAGTYEEHIELGSHAYVYGGFSGDESARDERDWRANVTTLSRRRWWDRPIVAARAGFKVSAIDGFTITGNVDYAGVYVAGSSPTIAHNTIMGNRTSGVVVYNSCPTISGNFITGNTRGIHGGGLYLYHADATVVNNVIAGNRARQYGGGLYMYHSSPTIMNNTIVANEAGFTGGGLFVHTGFPDIVNTIVAFNSSGLFQFNGNPLLRSNCVFGNTEYDYFNVADPTGRGGNMSVDPLFVALPEAGEDGVWGTEDDELGDLQLSAGSPCVDAGDNAGVPVDALDLDGDGDFSERLPFDRIGSPRFVDDPVAADVGGGVAPIVDMGAYERLPGDCGDDAGVVRDGAVDLVDYAGFAECADGAPDQVWWPCECSDANGDGFVDLLDFAVFQVTFTGG